MPRHRDEEGEAESRVAEEPERKKDQPGGAQDGGTRKVRADDNRNSGTTGSNNIQERRQAVCEKPQESRGDMSPHGARPTDEGRERGGGRLARRRKQARARQRLGVVGKVRTKGRDG